LKDPILAILEGGAQRAGAPDELMVLIRSDPDAVGRLIAHLNGADPRVRSGAAVVLGRLAGEFADLLAGQVPGLVQALEHEELPTRAGAWRAIAAVAARDPGAVEDDFDTIRLGLFEPLNSEIRAEAARTVASFGGRDVESARRAFPHLAEALRRFHDRDGAADLVRGLADLARSRDDLALRRDIWRAARRHENHPDADVRRIVREIGTLAG
jgi:hypothetical protein